eukprot:CAMPEP_0177405764 /NCGR_PEP_ID=MMETSP0368-20130122/62170_1 /TAXON_ID=447022 ORGANISM="Scrippsiella hangoei-like, Strain SHHI-4" /NCGR_SAMPLE_ID=MMETSP0368 /ASSEMBLY_ACC=CAM_ASM_000363 /LENGTH=47 /DNA_ID= /DNA_START= /DNA_END= /DNA_ORIENTATION=
MSGAMPLTTSSSIFFWPDFFSADISDLSLPAVNISSFFDFLAASRLK